MRPSFATLGVSVQTEICKLQRLHCFSCHLMIACMAPAPAFVQRSSVPRRETVRLLNRLYQWDVMRANKVPFAWGVEARVPFLDKAFLDLVMNIDPAEKMVRRPHITPLNALMVLQHRSAVRLTGCSWWQPCRVRRSVWRRSRTACIRSSRSTCYAKHSTCPMSRTCRMTSCSARRSRCAGRQCAMLMQAFRVADTAQRRVPGS